MATTRNTKAQAANTRPELPPAPTVLFCQRVMYDRSRSALCGDLYVGAKPVLRAIMVVKSHQTNTAQYAAGTPYSAYITGGENFYGEPFNHGHWFATAEEAIAFAKAQLPNYKLAK